MAEAVGARCHAPSASPTSFRSTEGGSPASAFFSTVLVYETKAQTYIVAGTADKSRWRVLKISREETEEKELEMHEDPTEYTEAQCSRVLAAVADGNASSGGVKLVARGCGLVGTIRLLKSHYLVLITERRLLGRVCGHAVYGIGATKLVCIATAVSASSSPGAGRGGSGGTGENTENTARSSGPHRGDVRGTVGNPLDVRHTGPGGTPAATEVDERRYLRLLSWVDLSKGFFFSYTYRLTATLQANLCGSRDGVGGGRTCGHGQAAVAQRERGEVDPGQVESSSSNTAPGGGFDVPTALHDFDSMFSWNCHLSKSIRTALGDAAAAHWLVPIVHGFFQQRHLSLLGRRLVVTLIARRSRHFAGTRYRRRGVNARGHVANEVETEQILDGGEAGDEADLWDNSHAGGGGVLCSGEINKGPMRRKTSLPRVSSGVQLRGSIPLFWSQEASPLMARPKIVLQPFDPLHAATASHFTQLVERYGDPILVLSLVRSQERRAREITLRGEMAAALHHVNSSLPPSRERIACVHWDFARHMMRGRGKVERSGGIPVASGQGASMKSAGEGDGSGSIRNGLGPAPHAEITTITPGLIEMTRVAAGALALTGLFAVGPRMQLEAAAGRQKARERGGAPGRAAVAWREAACELVTGLDCDITDPESIMTMGGGEPGAPAPGAGHSASPWTLSIGSLPTSISSSESMVPENANARWSQMGVMTQRGVLRSHCIDCLDRTNVAQFAWGVAVLGAQLEALGLADTDHVALDGPFAGVLMGLYRSMGNTLALQYSGSEAHTKVEEFRHAETAAGGGRGVEFGVGGGSPSASGTGMASKMAAAAASSSARLLTSARRFYSNTVTDADKQEGIDLFLGIHRAISIVHTGSALKTSGSKADMTYRAPAAPTTAASHGPPPVSSLNWRLFWGDFTAKHVGGGINEARVREGGAANPDNEIRQKQRGSASMVSFDTITARGAGSSRGCFAAVPVRLDHGDDNLNLSPKTRAAARADVESTDVQHLMSGHPCGPQVDGGIYADDFAVSREALTLYRGYITACADVAAGAVAPRSRSMVQVTGSGIRGNGSESGTGSGGSVESSYCGAEWNASEAAAAYVGLEKARASRAVAVGGHPTVAEEMFRLVGWRYGDRV